MNKKARIRKGKKGAYIGIFGNVALFIIKLVIAFVSGSYALIADSLHTFSDAVSSFVVLVGFHVTAKPADEEHHYGHGTAEAITGFIVAIMIILIGFEVGRGSITRLMQPGSIMEPDKLAVFGALISIGGKWMMTRITADIGRDINSPSLMADSTHHASDVLSSAAVLIGIILARSGYPFLDPLAGLLVSIFIVKVGFDVGKKNITMLMGTVPTQKLVEEINRLAMSVEGVAGVHSIKIYYMGVTANVQLHIEVSGDVHIVDADRLAHRVQALIISKSDDITSALVHVCPYKGGVVDAGG